MQPIKRSSLRIWLGARYYRLLRSLEWTFGSARHAMSKDAGLLPHTVFRHSTPLYRRLRNVDMWMQRNKVINLGIALRRIDGIVIRPGETLSYWRLIGKPTKRKGYVPGMVLFYGTFRPGIGGGLCQLSNLLYWMTLHTPLQVTERHRHSYDVFPDANRTQPFGSGATCAYNYIDLQICNPTQETFQLKLYLNETELAGEWRTERQSLYRYEVYEKEHAIELQPWGGYIRRNAIWRRTINGEGLTVADEWITNNEAILMYEPMLKGGSDA